MPGRPELPAYSYAFQPLVDVATRCVYSHEALVRGPQLPTAEAGAAEVAVVQDDGAAWDMDDLDDDDGWSSSTSSSVTDVALAAYDPAVGD